MLDTIQANCIIYVSTCTTVNSNLFLVISNDWDYTWITTHLSHIPTNCDFQFQGAGFTTTYHHGAYASTYLCIYAWKTYLHAVSRNDYHCQRQNANLNNHWKTIRWLLTTEHKHVFPAMTVDIWRLCGATFYSTLIGPAVYIPLHSTLPLFPKWRPNNNDWKTIPI